MFYLIRINRRDKPHSRTGNDNAAKNNSCPGNKRANFNYRAKRGREKSGTSMKGIVGEMVSGPVLGPQKQVGS